MHPQRTVVRFFIPAWADPSRRPRQADVRHRAIEHALGDADTWSRIRSQVSASGLVLTHETPESKAELLRLMPLLGDALSQEWGSCPISVQDEPVQVEITPDHLWAYRIQRWIAAKPTRQAADWSTENAYPAGEPREEWERATADKLHAALCREAEQWGITLPETPLLTVLDAGRPMPIPALRNGLHALARLGMLVGGHVRITGLLAAGKLARLGCGWLERSHVPRDIGAATVRRLSRRADAINDLIEGGLLP